MLTKTHQTDGINKPAAALKAAPAIPATRRLLN